MAITVRVGQALGREDIRAARRAGAVGICLSVGVMGVAALVMFVFPWQIASIYSGDPQVQAMAVALLGMAAIFQISDGLQVAGSGALRGLKDTSVPMLFTLTAYWGVGLPLALGLGFQAGLGPRGAWIGLIAGLTVAAVLLNVRFYWKTRTLLRAEDAAPPEVEREPLQACG
jgi:MATE family multidrug resistance protein